MQYNNIIVIWDCLAVVFFSLCLDLSWQKSSRFQTQSWPKQICELCHVEWLVYLSQYTCFVQGDERRHIKGEYISKLCCSKSKYYIYTFPLSFSLLPLSLSLHLHTIKVVTANVLAVSKTTVNVMKPRFPALPTVAVLAVKTCLRNWKTRVLCSWQMQQVNYICTQPGACGIPCRDAVFLCGIAC